MLMRKTLIFMQLFSALPVEKQLQKENFRMKWRSLILPDLMKREPFLLHGVTGRVRCLFTLKVYWVLAGEDLNHGICQTEFSLSGPWTVYPGNRSEPVNLSLSHLKMQLLNIQQRRAGEWKHLLQKLFLNLSVGLLFRGQRQL